MLPMLKGFGLMNKNQNATYITLKQLKDEHDDYAQISY